MAQFTTKQIRNVCFMGHGGSGKTSIVEAMLYFTGTSDRLGKVPDGNTVSDFDAEEIKRGFSIYTSIENVIWKNTKINILDTPGFLNFEGEVHSALRVADAAIIAVDAKSGIEVGTELAWERAKAAKLPTAFFVNKYDDPDAHFHNVFDSLSESFGKAICPVLIPAYEKGSFINLLDLKKYVYDGTTGKRTEGEINPEYKNRVETYRDKLMEAVSVTDEELMMKYLEGEEITKEEAANALHEGIISGEIVPVFSGSAAKLWGIDLVMDIIADSFPRHTAKKTEALADGDEIEITTEGGASLYVFKTSVDQFGRTTYFKVMNGELRSGDTLRNLATDTDEKFLHFSTVNGKKQTEVESLSCGDIGAITKLVNTNTCDTLAVSAKTAYAPAVYPVPVYTVAVSPKAKGDEDKIVQGIQKIMDEDKTVHFESDPETRQLLLSTMGDMQVDVVLSKVKARGGPAAELSVPKIAYRETIKGKADVQGKHKKQSGGHGQYGDVKIRFSQGEDEGLTFTTSVVGGSVPKNFFPAIEKGLQEAMQKGVLAGYPVVNLAADLYDGSYHDVDSNELSFKMAASIAYKTGLPLAKPVLLEPIGELNVTIPEAMVGDVMGDINGKRRGAVLGMNPSQARPGYTTIDAEVPKAEMTDYAIALLAITQGRGSFVYNVTRYDEVPSNIAQKVIAEAKEASEDK
ncbi:MAG: elongation factor G [Clostridia bacterium]|nr:elongation factor G [Clostridia bacterium]MBR3714544.1 elongation factor G [Clostridia bacterium]